MAASHPCVGGFSLFVFLICVLIIATNCIRPLLNSIIRCHGNHVIVFEITGKINSAYATGARSGKALLLYGELIGFEAPIVMTAFMI